MTIIAAADGSALGNPGPAGWAWYVDDGCWASGGWPHGTNNMGELMAVLDLLQQTAHVEEELLIFCDSRYVIDSLTRWMPGWKRNGWIKKDKKPVLNVELMKSLDQAMAGREIRFEWVKGHAGHELNEAADLRANAAATAYQDGGEPDRGPGFSGGSSAHPVVSVGQTIEEPDLFSDFPEPTDEEIVVDLERALLTDRDVATMAASLHPDWSEIGQSGRLWTREEQLAETGPLPEPRTLEMVSVQKLRPDVILLVWRAVGEEAASLRSSIWVREGQRWLLRFGQGTTLS